jgi:hypothetical protein
MPAVTRWVLRTALLWAIIATATGVMLVWPGAPSFPYPTYLHLFTVGWLSNLIFGVAHWMFPRASAARPRGDERLAWTGWALLNTGLLCRIGGEALRPVAMDQWLLLSAAIQFIAVLVWVTHLWPRVKER